MSCGMIYVLIAVQDNARAAKVRHGGNGVSFVIKVHCSPVTTQWLLLSVIFFFFFFWHPREKWPQYNLTFICPLFNGFFIVFKVNLATM